MGDDAPLRSGTDAGESDLLKRLPESVWALLDGFRTSGNPFQGLEEALIVGSP